VSRYLRVVVVVAVVITSMVSMPLRRAHAADTSKADALVNQAVELRRDGDDQGALPLLVQAYGMSHSPRTTAQLGLCEQAMGRWTDAEIYLTESLKAENDAWIRKNRRTLEDAIVIVKSHIARVEIEGEPEGAEIWINGILAGKLPLSAPVRVSAGELELELRAPGFVRETKTMRLEAGQYQRIVLRARKEAVTPPSAPAQAPAPTTNVVVALDDKREQPKADEGAEPRASQSAPASTGRLSLKWIAWGLGAVGLGIGFYGVEQHSALVSTFDETCAINMGMAGDKSTGARTTGCDAKKAAYDAKAHLAVGGFVAGGVLALTGFVLWATEPAPSSRGESIGLACLPAVTDHLGAALGCSFRF
jgi:PEGA domain